MKDYSREELELSRPQVSPLEAVEFCLQQLYADKTKTIDDRVAGCCTYEELIGALLHARDELEF